MFQQEQHVSCRVISHVPFYAPNRRACMVSGLRQNQGMGRALATRFGLGISNLIEIWYYRILHCTII